MHIFIDMLSEDKIMLINNNTNIKRKIPTKRQIVNTK